jgi:hypothetical protein
MSIPPPPGPGPGGFPGQTGGGYVPAAQETWLKGGNDKATTAIILAVVGLMCCGPLQIPAFILGYQAYKLAEERGGDGRGKAITAMVLSGSFLALWLLIGLLYLVSATAGATQ